MAFSLASRRALSVVAQAKKAGTAKKTVAAPSSKGTEW